MSINNSHSNFAHPRAAEEYKMVVYKHQEQYSDRQSYEKAQQEADNTSRRSDQQAYTHTHSTYSNTAHEMYHGAYAGYENLRNFSYRSVNPGSFSKSFYSPSTSYNRIDAKRHQNYFDSMMNYDTPKGAWVDVSA